MTKWLAGAESAIAAVQGFLGPSFGAFLLLCGAAALLLLAVVTATVVAAAVIGDQRSAARLKPQAASWPASGHVRAVPGQARAVRPAALKDGAGLTILFATDTGNAEGLAVAAGQAASRLGFGAQVKDMADTTPAEAAGAERLIVIASTWGEGEPPPRAADFYDALMAPGAPRFDGVRFAVLALGDRAYARLSHFCETGRFLDARLEQLGGSRVVERSDCDADYEAQADAWIGTTLRKLASPEQLRAASPAGGLPSVVQVEIAGPAGTAVGSGSRVHPYDAEIVEKIGLSGAGSDTRTFHVAVSLAGSGILVRARRFARHPASQRPGDDRRGAGRRGPERQLRAAGIDGGAL